MNITFEIPQGETTEEIQQRKKIIKDFYAHWNAENPNKCIYNSNLQDFINVRFYPFKKQRKRQQIDINPLLR